ncbi:MAG: hypothetical protein IJU75_04165 [Clostridia bacterium]|nr:hypothetical protein [Clostridia bacterium]
MIQGGAVPPMESAMLDGLGRWVDICGKDAIYRGASAAEPTPSSGWPPPTDAITKKETSDEIRF